MNHPGFVGVPDPRTTQGLRSYREKDEPHPLQLEFLTEAGEKAFADKMRALLVAGNVAEADRILTEALAGFDGSLAGIARSLRPQDVTIDGWEDLLPILDELRGPAITGMPIGLTNEADLVFEGSEPREPSVMLGLYSDEVFDFTGATREALLAECASEMPGWAGHEEDVEFYVDCAGLGELNTALIQCKHRYFLRDGRDGIEGRAPGGYVEYLLGTWLRATRFVQAVQAAASEHGVPAGAKLLAGTVALHTDFATLVEQRKDVELSRSDIKPLASLTIKRWAPRPDPLMEIEATGSALRHKLASGTAPSAPAGEPAAEPVAARPSPFSQPSPALVIPSVPPLAPREIEAAAPAEPAPAPAPAPSNPPISIPLPPIGAAATQARASTSESAPVPAPIPAVASAPPVEAAPLKTFEEKRGFFARLFGRTRAD